MLRAQKSPRPAGGRGGLTGRKGVRRKAVRSRRSFDRREDFQRQQPRARKSFTTPRSEGDVDVVCENRAAEAVNAADAAGDIAAAGTRVRMDLYQLTRAQPVRGMTGKRLALSLDACHPVFDPLERGRLSPAPGAEKLWWFGGGPDAAAGCRRTCRPQFILRGPRRSRLVRFLVWHCLCVCHARRVFLCGFSPKTLPQSCAAARGARALLAPGPTLARRDAELQFFMPSSMSQSLIMRFMPRSAMPLRDAHTPWMHGLGNTEPEIEPRHRRSGTSCCPARQLASSMFPLDAGRPSAMFRLAAAGCTQSQVWAGSDLCQVQSCEPVLACELASAW